MRVIEKLESNLKVGITHWSSRERSYKLPCELDICSESGVYKCAYPKVLKKQPKIFIDAQFDHVSSMIMVGGSNDSLFFMSV